MWENNAIQSLNQHGVAMAPSLTYQQISEVKNYFRDKLVWNGHVIDHSNQQPILWTDAVQQEDWPMFCAHQDVVVGAPHLFEHALNMNYIARAYFGGERPLLYSMNAFWTQPATTAYRDTHEWHRDPDDHKQMCMFIYGEDVMVPENGAHFYQVGTQMRHVPEHLATRPELEENMHRVNASMGRPLNQCPPEKTAVFLGPAGTTFLTDPSGIHVGARPNKLRMLIWARWGTHAFFASEAKDRVPPEVLGGRYPIHDAEMLACVEKLFRQ